jgi:hypothetical protein
MYASSRASGDADDSRAPPDGAGAALCAVWRDVRIKRRACGVADVADTRRDDDDDNDDDDDDDAHDPLAHARTRETPRDVACVAKDILRRRRRPRRRRRRRRRARE